MIALRDAFARLCRDSSGAMAIETALIAPVLVTLAIGGFEVSTMVSRQTELQSAAAEAAAVVRATAPATSEERTAVRNILKTSTGLNSYQVWVFPVYRCGTASSYVLNSDNCATTDVVSEFIRVAMFDIYQPMWTDFGVGGPILYSVNRTIQVG